jgi:hypothetical protein
VLEKVSLIEEISLSSPHRGHLDVLASFSMEELARARPIRCFDDLHAAWSERLNIFPPDVPRDLTNAGKARNPDEPPRRQGRQALAIALARLASWRFAFLPFVAVLSG